MKVSRSGGTPTVLATGQNVPEGIAVNATNVYWTNMFGNTVMTVPLAGGTPTTVVTLQAAGGIAIDAASVYWMAVRNNQVMKSSLASAICQDGVCL